MGVKSQDKSWQNGEICSNLKSDFFAWANKVVGDKDKVTLMSYEKCQRFAIAFFLFCCRLSKERRINFPLNNFQFPSSFVFLLCISSFRLFFKAMESGTTSQIKNVASPTSIARISMNLQVDYRRSALVKFLCKQILSDFQFNTAWKIIAGKCRSKAL